MFEFTQDDISSQVANLPLAFRVWFQWMFAVIVLMPVLFVRHSAGRVAVGFSLVFFAVQLPLMRMVGLTNLLSLTTTRTYRPTQSHRQKFRARAPYRYPSRCCCRYWDR